MAQIAQQRKLAANNKTHTALRVRKLPVEAHRMLKSQASLVGLTLEQHCCNLLVAAAAKRSAA